MKAASGTYSGALTGVRSSYLVTLTVAHGKLSHATVSNVPLYCSSGGPAIPVSFGSAKISRTGAFKTTGKQKIKTGPFKGKTGEKLTMAGRFTSHGTVSGTLKTTFVLNGPQCVGSSRFSAKR